MIRSKRAAVALLAFLALPGCLPVEGGEAKGGSSRLVAALGGDAPQGETGEEQVVYYRYEDESGALRFVERLDQVPASQREGSRIEWRAEAGTEGAGQPATSRWAGLSRAIASRLGSDAAPPSPQRGARPEVVLYTTSWCGWCRKTIAHLDANGVRYDNRDIERDREAYAELQRKTGSTGVPVIEIDGELVIGFDRQRIDQLLGL